MDSYTLHKHLLEEHGFITSNITQITTGKFNKTYIAEYSDSNDKVVLRIAPHDSAGFLFYEKNMMAQEPDIHRVVREKTSVPVPQIFIYDDTRTLVDRDFMIMEFIEGTPLSEAVVSSKSRKKIMEQTGAYLRELHKFCQEDQYGYLGRHNCMKPQNNWKSAFYIMWNKLIDDIEYCGVYNDDNARLAREAVEICISSFQRNIPASLLHMDIWAQNILVDDNGNIKGIVDWDRALWGDPEIEYAVLDYCGFNNSSFWKGYGIKPEYNYNAKIRGVFYHLYEVQKYLVIRTLRGNGFSVSDYKDYSLNILKKLI